MYESPDGSLTGYLNNSLAFFNTSDFHVDSRPYKTEFNVTLCRYQDYREPPWAPNQYEKTSMYWIVLAARLAFVVLFEVSG